MNPDPRDIGSELRKQRERVGMTIPEAAQGAGLTFQTVYRVEKRGKCSLVTLLALCDSIGILASTIFNRASRPAEQVP